MQLIKQKKQLELRLSSRSKLLNWEERIKVAQKEIKAGDYPVFPDFNRNGSILRAKNVLGKLMEKSFQIFREALKTFLPPNPIQKRIVFSPPYAPSPYSFQKERQKWKFSETKILN